MADEGRIPTNLRTLLILEVIGRSDTAMTATEINETIGLPKQTIHRLVTMLTHEGFLIREDDGKRFRPSRRLREIGAGVLFASRSYISRHQIMQDVASTVRETVNYVVPEETGMHYLDRVETDWPFRIQLPRGTNVPFHCTASGKTYLASLPVARRKKLVAALALEARSPNSITDPDALLAELSEIASQGYAIDNEELMEGMVALAAPVLDQRGRYIAAIAFHGPTPRLTIDIAKGHLEMLKEASRDLTEALFADQQSAA